MATEKNRLSSGESSDDIIQLMNIKKVCKVHSSMRFLEGLATV